MSSQSAPPPLQNAYIVIGVNAKGDTVIHTFEDSRSITYDDMVALDAVRNYAKHYTRKGYIYEVKMLFL